MNKEKKMKKLVLGMVIAAAAFAVQADLVNGTFTNGIVENRATVTLSHVDLGWYNSTGVISDNLGYLELGRGQFNNQNYWHGQIWTDNNATTGSQDVNFDVVLDQYSSGVSGAQVLIEIYGSDTATTVTPFDLQEGSAPGMDTAFTQIGSRLVYDVSGGTGSYSASLNFGSGYDYLAMRIGIYATGQDGGWGEDIGIDNVSIVPEPATVGMLGLGALVALMTRRVRS